jgi:hypothetical protein
VTRHKVTLRHEQSGGYVDAELIERVDAALAKRAEDAWQTYIATAKVEALAANRPFPVLAHSHWEWERKVSITERLLPYPTLGIECAGHVQGLMLLETDGHFGQLPTQGGSPLVYVNILATAPWNLPGVTDPPRYRGVGTVLLTAAASMSVDLGFKGRLGLHSLPKSEEWYNRLGMTCLGSDPNKQGLKYYEMSPDQAQHLIR